MAKERIEFQCKECQHRELRWLGRCPECSSWNSFEQMAGEVTSGERGRRFTVPKGDELVRPVPMTQVTGNDLERISVQPQELARVLGGGLVPGSLLLLGGAPGVGKSTLLTTLAAAVASPEAPVVYLSAEESAAQVRRRAERLGAVHDHLLLLQEPALERVLPPLYESPPRLLVIDSIQTVFSQQIDGTPGSVSQIRMCGGLLADFARATGCAVLMIGHLTKDGDLAGPRLLEHLVDTVLYFEPDAGGAVRMVRAFKNRFGATGELAVFEMDDSGLVPVRDASALFLRGRQRTEHGSAVTAILSGTRPLLVEVQALLATTRYATPARVVSGVDSKRVALLAAILERRANVKLMDQDIYVKVAGGVRVSDPAADLALVAAMASSLKSRPVPADVIVLGEVGLTGELRPVANAGARLREAEGHGFERAVLPAVMHGRAKDDAPKSMKVHRVKNLREALAAAFNVAEAQA